VNVFWAERECSLSRAWVYLEPSERILSQSWVPWAEWTYFEPSVSAPWAERDCTLSREWVHLELTISVTVLNLIHGCLTLHILIFSTLNMAAEKFPKRRCLWFIKTSIFVGLRDFTFSNEVEKRCDLLGRYTAIVLISYRRFGTTYRSHLQGSRIQMCLLCVQ